MVKFYCEIVSETQHGLLICDCKRKITGYVLSLLTIIVVVLMYVFEVSISHSPVYQAIFFLIIAFIILGLLIYVWSMLLVIAICKINMLMTIQGIQLKCSVLHRNIINVSLPYKFLFPLSINHYSRFISMRILLKSIPPIEIYYSDIDHTVKLLNKYLPDELKIFYYKNIGRIKNSKSGGLALFTKRNYLTSNRNISDIKCQGILPGSTHTLCGQIYRLNKENNVEYQNIEPDTNEILFCYIDKALFTNYPSKNDSYQLPIAEIKKALKDHFVCMIFSNLVLIKSKHQLGYLKAYVLKKYIRCTFWGDISAIQKDFIAIISKYCNTALVNFDGEIFYYSNLFSPQIFEKPTNSDIFFDDSTYHILSNKISSQKKWGCILGFIYLLFTVILLILGFVVKHAPILRLSP